MQTTITLRIEEAFFVINDARLQKLVFDALWLS
jgi:hypothetical protein